jgi:seryl-tRNA synthetase
MLTCDITPAKQVKLNMPVSKPNVRQRDPDAFRLMWHNREVSIDILKSFLDSFLFSLKAKVEQIPIEIEALRCEQNKLLQQLKQNSTEPSSSIDNNELRKQIDELSKKMEQLRDEEKNLRRLIRKKNMR